MLGPVFNRWNWSKDCHLDVPETLSLFWSVLGNAPCVYNNQTQRDTIFDTLAGNILITFCCYISCFLLTCKYTYGALFLQEAQNNKLHKFASNKDTNEQETKTATSKQTGNGFWTRKTQKDYAKGSLKYQDNAKQDLERHFLKHCKNPINQGNLPFCVDKPKPHTHKHGQNIKHNHQKGMNKAKQKEKWEG